MSWLARLAGAETAGQRRRIRSVTRSGQPVRIEVTAGEAITAAPALDRWAARAGADLAAGTVGLRRFLERLP